MSYYEGEDTGRGGICEDAPCCGCCGTSLYGSESGWYDEPMEADDHDDWRGQSDYDDEDESGWYDGSEAHIDSAMEASLFGDC